MFDPKAFAEAFAAAYNQAQQGMKIKGSPSSSPTGSWIHGPGGLFGPAIREPVISARLAPMGISSILPAIGVPYTHPEYAYITGIESTGNEPSSECESCVSAVTQGCIQTAQFGYICRESKTLTPSRAIERINAGELPLQLANDVLGISENDFYASLRSGNQQMAMEVATAWAMIEAGAAMQNTLVPMIWQGNPANSVGSGYKEFPGLDILISRNKVDAHTGVSCEALYSDVESFDWQDVGATYGSGGFLIVHLISSMEAYLYHNASRQGLLPVEWAFVMRPELWYMLSEIWPLVYATTRNITLPGGNTTSIDAMEVRRRVDEIRGGMFLYVNGRQHRVITDDGIFEYDSTNSQIQPGEFASTIYMVPLTFLGGQPATFLQYKDYSLIGPEVAAGRMANEWWSDDGRFLWTTDRQKWCYTLSVICEPRIVLLLPQLAGRIDYVKYTPAQHFRSPDENSPYFFKGGTSAQPSPSLWSDWNMP